MPHIFWNRQAVSCPTTPFIANVCIISKKKKKGKNWKILLLSQIPQEYVCIFVLQTEISFSLILGNKAYVMIVIVFQASMTISFWVHEQTSAQFASHSTFYTSNWFYMHKTQD